MSTDHATAPLRIVPLGGLGEIGKNMAVVEYGDRMVVVDCGVRFPTPEMHGIDLVLPDFSYVLERRDRLDAIVITHGHEDHLGGLPWVVRELGPHHVPRVYGRRLTAAMAQSKLDEHKLRSVEVMRLEPGDEVAAGPFTLELVHLTHSIPDAAGVALTCPAGTVLFTGDYRFDHTPVDGRPPDLARLARFGEEGLLVLCGDSTNADRAGVARSEADVGDRLREVFARATGRIIVTSFASNIHRVQQVVDAAEHLGRRVALVGRSMVRNVNIGRDLGHIRAGNFIEARGLGGVPDEELVIVCTGSQGEPLSALRRMAYGEHRDVKLRTGDTVVFSATPVPGNERAVNETVDRLYYLGCDVVTPADAAIHTSGHAHRDELKLMLSLTRPRYLMPVHGDFKRIRLHAELARAAGIPEDRIVRTENGQPAEFDAKSARLAERVTAGMTFVDGIDLGDVTEAALRDRRNLSGDGLLVVVCAVSSQEGDTLADHEVVVRGVPLVEDEETFVAGVREAVEDALDRAADDDVHDASLIEQIVHDDVAAWVYKRVRRRPMVLPVVVEI